jgi:hypothetical protein
MNLATAVEFQSEIERLQAEIERLRLAIRRLAEQDATLSVCDGAVTVTIDITLTDAERKAIREAADAYALDDLDSDCDRIAATLRGLLERTK